MIIKTSRSTRIMTAAFIAGGLFALAAAGNAVAGDSNGKNTVCKKNCPLISSESKSANGNSEVQPTVSDGNTSVYVRGEAMRMEHKSQPGFVSDSGDAKKEPPEDDSNWW